MPVLTAVDILGIQRYVFASNRLRDVLAASWMVAHATSNESLQQWPSENPSKVLLAAGGNAILEFDSLDRAQQWTAHYTRWLYDTAPGLAAVVAHRPFTAGQLAWALRALQIDLAQTKLRRRPHVPQLGLSVTASCNITGLPATDIDQGKPVSRQIKKLRKQVNKARERWREFLPKDASCKFRFPREIDDMGRSYGERSLVGVVHIDGNDVGQQVKDWLGHCIEDGLDDNTVRQQYGEWSKAITELGREVTKRLVRHTVESVRRDGPHHRVDGTPAQLGFHLKSTPDDSGAASSKVPRLPLQPLLLGGDDLTFLCDGRIALDLAASAMKAFDEHTIPHLGKDGKGATITACAGVALVKAHAPFNRSYQLAEALCRSAKRERREANGDPGAETETGCWLDWHIGTTRPGELVEEIRNRQYNRGKLTMRPYPLVSYQGRNQSWGWLDEELLGPGIASDSTNQGFRGAKQWKDSRSRVKRLAMIVADGDAAIEAQLKAWNAIAAAGSDTADMKFEKDIRLPGQLGDGYVSGKTPLLDAIELMDIHLRLAPHPVGEPAATATTSAAKSAAAGRHNNG